MNIIYVSKTVSKPHFKKIYDDSVIKPQQQDQKFHHLIIEGLHQKGYQVDVISSRPINRQNQTKIFFKRELETVHDIHYSYLPFFNIKLLRQIGLFLSAYASISRLIRYYKKDVVLFCDPLNVSVSMATIWAKKRFKVKAVGVATDHPLHLESKSRTFKKLSHKYLKAYDAYITLTHSMAEVLEIGNKPYVVIEGLISDEPYSKPCSKNDRFTFFYAGGLSKESGIDLIIDAFDDKRFGDAKLQICGHGELETLINERALDNPNIEFLGTLPNEEIIKLEHEAHVLLNPRPKKHVQTMHAFPSKVLEYMAAGTAVLSTKLSGIPNAYDEYLIYFDEETIHGMRKKMLEVYAMDLDELHEIGQAGKYFAYQEKTQSIQVQKIIDVLL